MVDPSPCQRTCPKARRAARPEQEQALNKSTKRECHVGQRTTQTAALIAQAGSAGRLRPWNRRLPIGLRQTKRRLCPQDSADLRQQDLRRSIIVALFIVAQVPPPAGERADGHCRHSEKSIVVSTVSLRKHEQNGLTFLIVSTVAAEISPWGRRDDRLGRFVADPRAEKQESEVWAEEMIGGLGIWRGWQMGIAGSIVWLGPVAPQSACSKRCSPGVGNALGPALRVQLAPL